MNASEQKLELMIVGLVAAGLPAPELELWKVAFPLMTETEQLSLLSNLESECNRLNVSV